MRKTIISLCLSVALGAGAQTLHKEITVDRASEPDKREAARIGVLPSVWLPAMSASPLGYSDKVVSARVPNTITLLEPVAYGNSDSADQYNGYVKIGLFPLFNADVSAGMRFIDNSTTRLSFHAQYDASVYHRGHYSTPPSSKFEHGGKIMWRDHTFSAGLDLHQAIGRKSMLDAGVSYTFGRHNQPGFTTDNIFSQSTSRVDLNALFTTSIEALRLKAGLKASHFGFYSLRGAEFGPWYFEDGFGPGLDIPSAPTQRQNRAVITLGGELPASESSRFGLDLTVDLLRNVRPYAVQTIPFNSSGSLHKKNTNGVYTISPYFSSASQTFNIRLGLDADLNSGDGSFFRIAPDVRLAWTPTQIFGAEIRATGGTELNSLASLYTGITPYLNPCAAYGRSHIPYDLDARLSFGPFLNTSIEVFGSYARARSWLMPVESGLLPGGARFEGLDFKGHRLGVAVAYDNGRTLAIRASYTTAPSGHEKGWYEWRDRARHVVDARLSVRPMRPLVIDLGYELRAGRADYGYSPYPEPSGVGDLYYYPLYRSSLGTISDLSIGANYAVNARLNIWAKGMNLLSRRYSYIGGHLSQGITGLVGLSYKF